MEPTQTTDCCSNDFGCQCRAEEAGKAEPASHPTDEFMYADWSDGAAHPGRDYDQRG